MLQQLLIDLDLFGNAQTVRHLDDIDAVEKCLVIAVVTELLPLALVGVGHDDAIERNRPHALGGVVVPLLRGREQRMQHLDRRLEHLDELHQPLVGLAQAAGEAVGIRVVLGIELQLTDIDLAHQ